MNNCKKYKEPVGSNCCPDCGKPVKLKRIDKHYIIQEVREFFFANKGFGYTIKKMLISPGESVRRFITEDRHRFVKPITFLFITSLIYALVSNLFNVTENYFQVTVEDSKVSLFVNKVFENFGYLNLLIGAFVSFWIKIFFRKSSYNIFEIFILFCFVVGITMLLSSVAVIIQGVTHWKIIQYSYLIGTIYVAWAIVQFFNTKKVTSYIKAFLSYLLGATTLAVIITVFILIEFLF